MLNDPVMIFTGLLILAALVVVAVTLFRRKGASGDAAAGGAAKEKEPAGPAVSPQRTVMMAMPEQDVPGGTVAMRWNGLLLCTAGDLEGERFIIEDDGFYIGRDAGLSKVVINDSRVSKRHVRITARDGTVFATDEDSTNGTYLNEAGTPRITEVALKKGDTLILADNVASFRYQI